MRDRHKDSWPGRQSHSKHTNAHIHRKKSDRAVMGHQGKADNKGRSLIDMKNIYLRNLTLNFSHCSFQGFTHLSSKDQCSDSYSDRKGFYIVTKKILFQISVVCIPSKNPE